MVKIVTFAGSLRAGSLNRWLTTAASRIAPAGLEIDVFDDLAGVPLFNEDLEAARPDGPGAVQDLRRLVMGADGILIATPEYNQSIPGVMKNVVDWLSRPDGSAVLDRKPVAIMGATTGPWGTRYAQKELRHALTAAGALVMPQPMLFLSNAELAIDAAGLLTDAAIQRRLAELLSAFGDWIGLFSPRPSSLVAAEA